MYCKACGQVIDNDSVFCSFCGVKQLSVVTKSEKVSTEISGEDRLQNNESKISRPVTPKYDDSFEKESTTSIVGFFMLIGTLILVIFKPIQFPSQSAYEQGRVFISIFSTIIRISATFYCVNLAKRLNREQFGWGVLAFFFPSIALIIMGNLKKLFNPNELSQTTSDAISANQEDELVNHPNYHDFPLLTRYRVVQQLSKIKATLKGTKNIEFYAAISDIINWRKTESVDSVPVERIKYLRQVLTSQMDFSFINDFYIKFEQSSETLKKFETEMSSYLELD